MDAEMVNDTCKNKPDLVNALSKKARWTSCLAERGITTEWGHKAMRTRTYVLHMFWRGHISDKNGRRGNIPPNALAVPKTAFSYAMTRKDKVERWNEDKWVGSKFAVCMWLSTEAALRWTWTSAMGYEASPPDHHGMCELGM